MNAYMYIDPWKLCVWVLIQEWVLAIHVYELVHVHVHVDQAAHDIIVM